MYHVCSICTSKLSTLGLGNFSHMHLKLEDTYLKYKLHTSIIHKSVGARNTLYMQVQPMFLLDLDKIPGSNYN